MTFWQKIKYFFMLIFLVISTIGLIFLVFIWLTLRKNKPTFEVDAIIFNGLVIAMWAVSWFWLFSFNHVRSIAKTQSKFEDYIFNCEKESQARLHLLEVQNKFAQTKHKNAMAEIQRENELKRQLQLEDEKQNKKKQLQLEDEKQNKKK